MSNYAAFSGLCSFIVFYSDQHFFVARIAVFSIRVLKDERIVIIAEQRPESTEEEVKADN